MSPCAGWCKHLQHFQEKCNECQSTSFKKRFPKEHTDRMQRGWKKKKKAKRCSVITLTLFRSFKDTHYHLLVASPTAVSGGEGGGTLLHIPRLLVPLAHGAHGNGVRAQHVAVTVAVVATATSIATRPHKQGSKSSSALRWGGWQQMETKYHYCSHDNRYLEEGRMPTYS